MGKEKTTNIYVDNQRIQIKKKHGFFSYFKMYILMSLLGILVFGIAISVFLMDYQLVLEILMRYTPVTITTIYAVIILFTNIKWLRNHLYIPLTHEELDSNQIKTCKQYRNVIYNMFYYKPLERAIHDIENTAKEEFQKEIDIWNFYNKERREQVIPICYVALFMSIFIYSLCNLGNEEFVAIQWITGIIYILIYKVLQDF